jgi:DNA-binding NarL/FixJ family response regulator
MNIAIIGPNNIFCDSLRTLLNQITDFNVLFDSGDFQDFRNHPESDNIDLVLIDGGTGNEGYIGLVEKVLAYSERIKVLILTDANDPYHKVQRAETGFAASLPKNSRKIEFESRIRGLTGIDHNI